MLGHLAKFAFRQAATASGITSLRNFRPGSTGRLFTRLSCSSQPNQSTDVWPEEIKAFLAKRDITEPTPIQYKTMSAAQSERNFVGVARTGAGKTLAYLVPVISKIMDERRADPTAQKVSTCLVVAPTRELVRQIQEVAQIFSQFNINSIALYGGTSVSGQSSLLQRRVHDIIIATPGRLIDLHGQGMVDLSQIKHLVIDEADRMLDMGFEPQLRDIVAALPKSRQTVMFSATWPEEVRELAADFLGEYEYLAVDSEELKANPNIEQVVEVLSFSEKSQRLVEIIQDIRDSTDRPKILIFVNTKRMADELVYRLMRERIRAQAIHGDKSQNRRDSTVEQFREGRNTILVATDVVARGIDINDITHVINYDFPNDIEAYVHRIGRTARHEKLGKSISLLTDSDAGIARKLIKVLKETNQTVPEDLMRLEEDAPRKSKPYNRSRPGYRTGGRDFQGFRQRRNYDEEDDEYNHEEDHHYGGGRNYGSRRGFGGARGYGGNRGRRDSVYRDYE